MELITSFFGIVIILAIVSIQKRAYLLEKRSVHIHNNLISAIKLLESNLETQNNVINQLLETRRDRHTTSPGAAPE